MLKRSARDPAGSCCRPQVENHCLPGTGRGNLQVWSNEAPQSSVATQQVRDRDRNYLFASLR